MNPTARTLLRWTGLAAIGAGAIFAAIQPIHPVDELASVTTTAWSIFMPLKLVMCVLFLAGFTGLYARQVGKAGWLGFAGFAMLAVCWVLQSGFIFTEMFVLPLLADAAPQFVDSFLGLANGTPGPVDIGAMTPAYALAGILYMLGGLVFGIATIRAGVLPKGPAILLAVAATLTPAAALLPHEIQRLAAIPVAAAVAWLGYALWSERRSPAERTVAITELRHTAG